MTQWPKQISASGFRKHWYADKSMQTIRNHINEGKLPGGQEDGQYFVWVNADMTPAHGYQGPTLLKSAPNTGGRGENIASQILANLKRA